MSVNKKKQPSKPQKPWFLIKLVVSTLAVILSYRYPIPIDSFRNQEMLTLVVVSIFLIAKPSPYFTLMKKSSHPKLFAVLVYAALIFPGLVFVNTKYQDWDNAQMLKGLARDFPALVADIEQDTGLDLVVDTNCMTTSEKFSSGVRTCELRFGLKASQEDVDRVFISIEENGIFVKGKLGENKKGYYFSYRRKDSCSFTNMELISGGCVVAVRDANVELAKSLF
jgi:hypothetical protein